MIFAFFTFNMCLPAVCMVSHSVLFVCNFLSFNLILAIIVLRNSKMIALLNVLLCASVFVHLCSCDVSFWCINFVL